MSAIDIVVEPPDDSARSGLKAALAGIAQATTFYDFENAWITGLRMVTASDGDGARDRVLAAAGERLSAFGELQDDVARRSWLDQIAEEVRLRSGGELSSELERVAATELREAFARVVGDLSELRDSVASGVSLNEFAARRPRQTNRVRDLGRIAESLRGTELLALCAAEDYGLARDLARAMKPPVHLVPTMPESLRVSRDDLIRWAKSDRGEKEFPRLVRSLIAETEPSAEWIDMPAGTGTASSGLDGIVRCARGNRFVPVGKSAWELTTQQDGLKKKASDDYEKRVKSSTTGQRAEIAYVAAACAPWTKRRSFESERTGDDDFDRVRGLNVDNLEDWLSCAVVTTVWMREQIGKPTAGISLLSGWWRDWLESTTVPLDSAIVLAGRDKSAEILRERCQRGCGIITVGGQVHRNEILAFVAAALLNGEPADTCGDILLVDSHDAARQLFAAESLDASAGVGPEQPKAAMVVPSSDFAQRLPADSRHLMVVPLPGSTQAEIVLEPVDGEVVTKHLEAAEGTGSDAYQLGAMARMSLMALRRHLAKQSGLHAPRWASDGPDASLRRCLLLGGWNEARKGDRRAVEQVVGIPYEEVIEALTRLDTGDAPMLRTGDLWHTVSPGDSWILVRDHLAPADLAAFTQTAQKVLTAADPLRQMSDAEAFNARIEGVTAEYSSQIKRGIATALALACSRPSDVPMCSAAATEWAESVVWQTLRAANEDTTPNTWSAVAEVLPLFAEAAPVAVLELLRSCLAKSHAFAAAMFADSDDDMFSSKPASPHFTILRALEIVAWSPDHLLSAMDVLARLAEIDPGGSYMNRPANSLASIMCPWMPHTSAEFDTRLDAIRMLVRSHNSVAWKLMLSMLPSSHDTQFDGPHPRFRDWRSPRSAVSRRERWDTVEAVADLLVDNAGAAASRWVDLLSKISSLPSAIRASAATVLAQVAAEDPTEQFKSALWPVLRETLVRHRQFHDTWWALSDAELEPFDRVLESLRPEDPVAAYGHVFTAWPRHIDGTAANAGHEAIEEAVRPRQEAAVRTILSAGGLSGMLEFAEAVEHPYQAGRTLAVCNPALDTEVLLSMEDSSDAMTRAALGYFDTRFAALGWHGIDRLITYGQPSPRVVADLLRSPPRAEQAWKRIDRFGPDVAAEYWSRVTSFELDWPDDLDELLELSRRLRTAGRFDLASDLLHMPSHDHTAEPAFAEEIAEFLSLRVRHSDADDTYSVMDLWKLTKMLEVIDRHREHLGANRVELLEWQYYPLVQHEPGFTASNLYRGMASDPGFFVQFVEWAFKPASTSAGDETLPDEEQQRLALNAWHLLREWPEGHFLPNSTDTDDISATADAATGSAGCTTEAALEGIMDAASLKLWVERARERLAEIDRLDIGDQQIGTALASSPGDPNGDWPSGAVRDLVERLESDDIDSGISMAIYNRRGITTRGITDGGAQERELVDSYRAQSRKYQEWPRTKAIFEGLARDYERQAGIADRQAEARRRGLPL